MELTLSAVYTITKEYNVNKLKEVLKEFENKELPPSKLKKKSCLTVGWALVKEKHILHLITH